MLMVGCMQRAFNIRWRDWDEIKEQGLGTGSVDNYLKREAAAASSGGGAGSGGGSSAKKQS